MAKKICPYCGKEFEPINSGQKYCCTEHQAMRYAESRRSDSVGREIECEFCGKVFKTKNVNSKYCSLECRYADEKKKYAEEREKKRSQLKCVHCGSPLTEYHSNLYCSKKCAREVQKQRLREHSKMNATAKQVHKSKKPKLSIGEICKLAIEEHLSYGQYVEKYGV